MLKVAGKRFSTSTRCSMDERDRSVVSNPSQNSDSRGRLGSGTPGRTVT